MEEHTGINETEYVTVMVFYSRNIILFLATLFIYTFHKSMRKILLMLFAATCLAAMSHAQEFNFQKGDILLEGNAGLYSTKRKGDWQWKSTSLTLNPKVGYLLTEKFAVGLDLGYRLDKNIMSGEMSGDSKTQSYRFGAFGRYYFLELGKRFKTYAEGAASYGFTNYDNYTNYDYDRLDTYAASAGIGANFFITPKIAIGYSFANLISYSIDKPDMPDADNVSRFNVNVNSFRNFFESGQFSLTFKF